MIVNVYCPTKDKSFCLDVGLDFTIKKFKMLCATEIGVSAPTINALFNNELLNDDDKSLSSYNISENDMILLEFQSTSPLSLPETTSTSDFREIQAPQQASAPRPSAGLGRGTSGNRFNPPFPDIDFSQVRVPGSSSSSRRPQSGGSNSMDHTLNDPIAFRKAMLDNPQHMETFRKIYPPVVEAILSGSEEIYIEEFFKMRNVLHRQQPLLAANPMDVEVQKKIAEEIERKNIEENMTMAMEEHPESFAQVVMLWINLKVNGHHVKAFVDSGAQMTIMSATCAERCNIMRLVDKRWEGVAKGVGTQKIIGRIHLAQIQIEDVFLQCSFCILEDQPMDVLLGLDMLRRHLCVIDLRENSLTIGTNNTKTHFLAETDLPSYGRLHDPNAPPPTTSTDKSKDGQVSFCHRQESNSSAVARVARKSSHAQSQQLSEVSGEADEDDQEPARKTRKIPEKKSNSSQSTS